MKPGRNLTLNMLTIWITTERDTVPIFRKLMKDFQFNASVRLLNYIESQIVPKATSTVLK